jgi:hypothetical protein
VHHAEQRDATQDRGAGKTAIAVEPAARTQEFMPQVRQQQATDHAGRLRHREADCMIHIALVGGQNGHDGETAPAGQLAQPIVAPLGAKRADTVGGAALYQRAHASAAASRSKRENNVHPNFMTNNTALGQTRLKAFVASNRTLHHSVVEFRRTSLWVSRPLRKASIFSKWCISFQSLPVSV